MGLVLAGVLGGFVAVMYVVTRGAILESRGLSLPSVLVVYLSSGVGGGLLWEILAPIGNGLLGRFLLGCLVAVPLSIGVAIIDPKAPLADPVTWVGAAAISVLLGGGAGVITWWEDSKGRRR